MSLADALHAVSIIAGHTVKGEPGGDLDSVLDARLRSYREYYVLETAAPSIRHQSGLAALDSLERINTLLIHCSEPLLGSRDLSSIRIAASLVFKWLTTPLLTRIAASWPAKRTASSEIIDLTVSADDHEVLRDYCIRLLNLATPGPNSTIPTQILVNKHLGDILKPAISVGWLPGSLIPSGAMDFSEIRALTMRLLNLLQPSLTLSTLGGILSSPQAQHVTKATSFLLGRQLIRPQGVRGLCDAVFGETLSDDEVDELVALQKIQHFSRVLSAVPVQLKCEEYFIPIISVCVDLLNTADDKANRMNPTHTRAIAFTLARFMISDQHGAVPQSISLALLLRPWGVYRQSSYHKHPKFLSLSVPESLRVMTEIVSNADSAPPLISHLITPILPEMYTLLSYLKRRKTADPTLSEMLKSLYTTWAKIVDLEEGIATLWSIIEGRRRSWTINEEGTLTWNEEDAGTVAAPEPAALLKSIEAREDVGEGMLDNPFNLNPSPSEFVETMKLAGRTDLSSGLFVRLLDAYLDLEKEQGDSVRSLLILQLIMHMQSDLTRTRSSTDILGNRNQILSFVDHALTLSVSTRTSAFGDDPRQNLSTKLKFTEDRASESILQEEGADSDDEDCEELSAGALDGADSGDSDGPPKVSSVSEEPSLPSGLVSTAVTLLLAVLEANEDLSTAETPLLEDIWDKLQLLTQADSQEERTLAREARMVLASRLATTSGTPITRNSGTQGSQMLQVKYQRALKLVKDPIIPVRAHGLTLLREVIASREPDTFRPLADAALVPAVTTIFLEAVQDEESFIFLNGVKGLSATIDTFGRKPLNDLINLYCEGLLQPPISSLTQQQLDVRLRFGEALAQVIRRCGETLPNFSDILIPPIFQLIGQSVAPVALRISAISVLSQIIETNWRAAILYLQDIVLAMMDLLRIESVAVAAAVMKVPASSGTSLLDQDPTTSGRQPAESRRAALHLLRICLETLNEDGQQLSSKLLQDLQTVLEYISVTDIDQIVRVMARDAAEVSHAAVSPETGPRIL